MKVLLTGATGFIGNHLVEAFKKDGKDIRCLVRKDSKIGHCKQLGVELVYGDLLNKASLKEAFIGVDIIYHLAGKVFAHNDQDFFDINVTGTKNLLEVSVLNNIKKFIYFSSIAAVGPNMNGKTLLNEVSHCRPITAYGRSKYSAERLIKEFSYKYKLSSIIIRPPMVYGPGAQNCRSSRLFQMIRRRNFFFIGDGRNIINTCYIDNLIHGILLLDAKKENFEVKIYCFADAEVLTLYDLVKMIAVEEGVKLSKIHVPILLAKYIAILSQGLSTLLNFTPLITVDTWKEVINNWNYDMTFTKKELGFIPKVKLIDGIKKTVLWYRSRANIL